MATTFATRPAAAGGLSRLWQRVRMNPTLEWGCEISAAGICLARWDDAGGMGAAAWRPLPPGALEISPLRENLLAMEEAHRALSGCLESLGRPGGSSGRPVDTAMVIPDQATRVFFTTFDEFPLKPVEAIPLIRWKLKKSVPFDIDASTISYVATRPGAEWQVLTVVTPTVIIRQYESLAEALGLTPRFVTISTLGALGMVASEEAAGAPIAESFLLAKLSPPWLTTAILYEGAVRLFRTTPIAVSATGEPRPDALREILEAIHPSVAYFQDNFGRSLEQAYLCGFGAGSAAVVDSLSNELNLPTRSLLQEAPPPVAGLDSREAERHLAALMGIARMRRRA
jgi:type IV pilus assembly protein PilM